MLRQSIDLLLLSIAASVALSSMGVVLGFGMHQSHNSRHYVPRSVSSIMFQETATWSEYKQEYVDPQVLTDHAQDRSMEDASYQYHQAKQAHAIADAYWAWQFEQDHEKLHQLNKEHVLKQSHRSDDNDSRSDSESLSLTDTWSHYKHDYIDKLPKQHVKHSHINDDNDDNSRSDSEYSSLTDTWSHYKHDYIDKLPKPHSLSP
jgi:hypothetical protein